MPEANQLSRQGAEGFESISQLSRSWILRFILWRGQHLAERGGIIAHQSIQAGGAPADVERGIQLLQSQVHFPRQLRPSWLPAQRDHQALMRSVELQQLAGERLRHPDGPAVISQRLDD
jgi:hypothetical protein